MMCFFRLSVCKITEKVMDGFLMKFTGNVYSRTRNRWLNFGGDPGNHLDPNILPINKSTRRGAECRLCKILHMIGAGHYSKIKDIDPIMPNFELVLPCNSSDAPPKFYQHTNKPTDQHTLKDFEVTNLQTNHKKTE